MRGSVVANLGRITLVGIFLLPACVPASGSLGESSSTASPTPYEPPLSARDVTPAPTATPVPTPKRILYRPRDFILAPEEFPLVGYKVTQDQENSAGGVRWEGAWTGGADTRLLGYSSWRRTYGPTARGFGDFEYVSIDLAVYEGPAYDSLPGSMLFAARQCEIKSGTDSDGYVPVTGTLVTAPQVGDQSAICAYTWSNGVVRYDLVSVNRNAFLYVQVRSVVASSTAAPNLALSIARLQWAVTDRLYPPR